MSHLTQDLAALLHQVRRPGSFYVSGSVDIHTPRVEVEGVGTLALPLLPVQAVQILEVAERAPYGRGSATLVDTEVRRTWQVDAGRVRIGGRYWEQELARVLERVTVGLGVSGRVRAELYKLLVYDAGSFFVVHRDTEKAPGMFATLVLVLPCDYQGGELLIRHKGQEARLDLHPAEPSVATFAAFYADCRHEVLPITAGYRLTLIYNLLREGAGPLPEPPDYEVQQAQASALLRAWDEAAGTPGAGPDKLVYPLEHAYTQAELGFDALKGADAAVAAVVAKGCEAADCDCHLALLTVEESGWAEYTGDGWDADAEEEEDEYEIGEVTDSSETLHDWRHPDGSRSAMGPLTFYGDELCPPDALPDLEDTEPEFEEATGNEGASFERSYQRAALVLWPRAGRAKILADGGLDIGVPFLGELIQRWEGGDPASGDRARQQALEFAAQIRQAWPTHDWERRQASESGHTRALFEGLARLGDLEQRTAFLAEQTLAGAYGAADNPALVGLLGQLPPEQAGDLLTRLIAHNGPLQADACARLLLLCTRSPAMTAASLRPAAVALIGALSDRGERADDASTFGATSPRCRTTERVTDTLTAFEYIDPVLAGKALEHFLSLPALYPMDALLLPAALTLHEARSGAEPAAFAALCRAVLAHLEQRIGEPLEAPADWTRAAEVACTCSHCADLNRFLASPDTPQWGLKAAEAGRKHVAAMIAQHRCDLDLTTDKRGRPYTLVCTKNQASYERRVRLRQQDLAHRARLEG